MIGTHPENSATVRHLKNVPAMKIKRTPRIEQADPVAANIPRKVGSVTSATYVSTGASRSPPLRPNRHKPA